MVKILMVMVVIIVYQIEKLSKIQKAFGTKVYFYLFKASFYRYLD